MFFIAEAERNELKEALATTKFVFGNERQFDRQYSDGRGAGVCWVGNSRKIDVCFEVIQSIDKPNASHITKAIALIMSGSEDATRQCLQKLVGCGTDGTGVMTGSRKR